MLHAEGRRQRPRFLVPFATVTVNAMIVAFIRHCGGEKIRDHLAELSGGLFADLSRTHSALATR